MSNLELDKKLSPADVAAYGAVEVSRRDTIAVGERAATQANNVAPEVAAVSVLPITARPTFPLFGWDVALPPSLRALGHRNFRLFWSGQLISLVGTWMQNIARGWLVLELTHSPFWLGMVGFANAFPVLIFSLWGGLIADRVPKRTLIIVTQAISMVMAFVLAALTLTHTVEVWHIVAVSLVLGTVFAFDAPARQSFTVEMVEGKEDLMNAVALNSSIFNGARVAGPAIGAIALAWQGPGMAFLLNGLSFLAVLAGLFLMKLPPHPKHAQNVGGKGKIIEGLNYVRRHSTIGVLMLLIATVSIFAFPYTVLMPIFADNVLGVGKEGYGMLMAFSGIGSLIGALRLAVKSGHGEANRGRIIFFGAVSLPLVLAMFALSSNYLLSLATLLVVGWAMIAINATVNTIIQTNVPDELRGRVNGVFALLFIGMAPLGNLQAGIVADHFGAPVAIFVGAVVTGLVVLYILLRHRHVFSMD